MNEFLFIALLIVLIHQIIGLKATLEKIGQNTEEFFRKKTNNAIEKNGSGVDEPFMKEAMDDIEKMFDIEPSGFPLRIEEAIKEERREHCRKYGIFPVDQHSTLNPVFSERQQAWNTLLLNECKMKLDYLWEHLQDEDTQKEEVLPKIALLDVSFEKRNERLNKMVEANIAVLNGCSIKEASKTFYEADDRGFVLSFDEDVIKKTEELKAKWLKVDDRAMEE